MRLKRDAICGRSIGRAHLEYDLACVRSQLTTVRTDSEAGHIWREQLLMKEASLLARLAAMAGSDQECGDCRWFGIRTVGVRYWFRCRRKESH